MADTDIELSADLIDPLATETTLAVNGVDPEGEMLPDEIAIGGDIGICRKGSGWDVMDGDDYLAFYDDFAEAFLAALNEVVDDD